MIELLRILDQPDREFTPIPFWFLNDDLNEDKMRRQLRDFRDHGVYGVVLHPRMGLPTRIEYLSETFFHYIRFAVTEAAELDMKVVLYDEGMYPSGSAGGQVVKGRPELASMGITVTKDILPGDSVLAETPQGVLVARHSGGTIRGVHFGEDDGEPQAPSSADILNPEAVSRFISLTHEAYYRELKEFFGSTVIGFFTDEPGILGRNVEGMCPWSLGFEQVFTAAGGKLSGLAGLFTGVENPDTALYHELILQREGEVYYAALSRWCAAHGIALMGHPHQSDDIEVERFFHIPGQDLVLRWIAPETGDVTGMDSTMAKCSADAARLMGRRRNSNECFGTCNQDGNPWQLSGGDIKWYLDYLAVRGVNLFIPHAFYYSIEGKRKDERPPDVGPNSIWWPHYRQWALYMQRLSCLMTDSEAILSTAVLCRNRDLKPELVAPLFQHQIGFQYLPESVWDECREEDGTLLCRGRRYTIVLGETQGFPTVPRFEWGKLTADCYCDPPQKDLRSIRFLRDGRECWFIVNGGNTTISTNLMLPTEQAIGEYDLWTGKAARRKSKPAPDCVCISLELPVRGSILLFTCNAEDWETLPERKDTVILSAPVFELVKHDPAAARKEYTAILSVSAEDMERGELTLEIEAEEMAELYVNGVFAGVGFWPPQHYNLQSFLKEGENELRLVVTGSMANLHGGRPVPYGLKESYHV